MTAGSGTTIFQDLMARSLPIWCQASTGEPFIEDSEIPKYTDSDYEELSLEPRVHPTNDRLRT